MLEVVHRRHHAQTRFALYAAKEQGEKVDPGIVERALASLEAARTDEGAYPYTTREGRDETIEIAAL